MVLGVWRFWKSTVKTNSGVLFSHGTCGQTQIPSINFPSRFQVTHSAQALLNQLSCGSQTHIIRMDYDK